MHRSEMNKNKSTPIPTPFRGLRVLLIDDDTASLLKTALILEDYSYKVTTTELASVALSILEERKDQFDLVMADFNMPETDCFTFLENVWLIKDYPIILMSSEMENYIVKEVMTMGVCFFLKKPISSKTLNNVWQHVYRKRRCDADQEIESQGAAKTNECKGYEKVRESMLNDPTNEQVGDNDYHIENDLDNPVDGSDSTKLSDFCIERSMLKENDPKLKRKRTEDDDGERTRVDRSDSEQEDSRNVKHFAGKEKEAKGKEKTLKNTSDLSFTPDLELKFKEVISALVDKETCPERVLEMMEVPNFEELSNHFEGKLLSYHTQSSVGNYLAQDLSVNSVSEDTHSFSEVSADLKRPEVDACQAFIDAGYFPMTFMNLLQETDMTKGLYLSEGYNTSKRSTRLPNKDQNLDSISKLATSSYSLNQNLLESMDDIEVKISERKKDPVEFNVKPTASDIASYSEGINPSMGRFLHQEKTREFNSQEGNLF